MEIKLIKSNDADDFVKKVNACLNEGWIVFGEPQVDVVVHKTLKVDNCEYYNTNTVYHQFFKKH